MDGLRTGREEDYEAWKQARDRHKERGVNKHFHLNAAASKWPTPRAITGGAESAQRKQELGRSRSGGSDLQAEAQNWPTPGANDHKGTAKVGQRRGQLDEAAEQKFQTSPYLPGPPAPKETGATSPSTSGLRLNHLFVEWLMGFPFGWISFEPWAMPSSPSRQHLPSET
jgi:hypothetical protein